ncbi:MAG: zf-HC2 domain-containing protein [Lawsonibacter sp.]|jgi:hypothetical protein
MGSCEEYEQLLSAQLDGELSQEDEVRLKEHLTECPACRELEMELQQIHAAFPELEELSPPDGFAQEVMAKIRAQEPTASRQEENSRGTVIPFFRRPAMRSLVGLAACALLCMGVYQAGLLDGIPASADRNMGEVSSLQGKDAEDGAGGQSEEDSLQPRLQTSASLPNEGALSDESQIADAEPQEGIADSNLSQEPGFDQTAGEKETPNQADSHISVAQGQATNQETAQVQGDTPVSEENGEQGKLTVEQENWTVRGEESVNSASNETDERPTEGEISSFEGDSASDTTAQTGTTAASNNAGQTDETGLPSADNAAGETADVPQTEEEGNGTSGQLGTVGESGEEQPLPDQLAGQPVDGILTMEKLPEEAENVLGGEIEWFEDEEGRPCCILTGTQMEQIVNLALEQKQEFPQQVPTSFVPDGQYGLVLLAKE